MNTCVFAHEFVLQSFVKKYKEILSANADEQTLKMCLCFQFGMLKLMENQNMKRLGKFTVFYTRHVGRLVPVSKLLFTSVFTSNLLIYTYIIQNVVLLCV